jgi:hypothetical protein
LKTNLQKKKILRVRTCMQKAKSLKQTGPGIQDEEQWARNVEGYMRGLSNPGSMSAAAPILIPLKQWCGNKW